MCCEPTNCHYKLFSLLQATTGCCKGVERGGVCYKGAGGEERDGEVDQTAEAQGSKWVAKETDRSYISAILFRLLTQIFVSPLFF